MIIEVLAEQPGLEIARSTQTRVDAGVLGDLQSGLRPALAIVEPAVVYRGPRISFLEGEGNGRTAASQSGHQSTGAGTAGVYVLLPGRSRDGDRHGDRQVRRHRLRDGAQ